MNGFSPPPPPPPGEGASRVCAFRKMERKKFNALARKNRENSGEIENRQVQHALALSIVARTEEYSRLYFLQQNQLKWTKKTVNDTSCLK